MIFVLILVLVTIIGLLLTINRYWYSFLPNNNWRILFDHFIAGFLFPIWFFILYLGVGSFFLPNRKIIYSIKWFLIYACFTVFLIFLWEIVVQRLKDVDQIISELLGILLSFVYFIKFRSLKIKLFKINTTKQ